jgi:argonaute-like protein implicated in RNA metabolism and viral defense
MSTPISIEEKMRKELEELRKKVEALLKKMDEDIAKLRGTKTS